MTKMTNKIPTIETIGTKAEHLSTATKAKPDGDFPFDDLVRPGLIEPIHLKATDKINQMSLFKNQNRTEEGKRTPLKTKPILDTSKLRQKTGEETQAIEAAGVTASGTKGNVVKNTQKKANQILETGEQAAVVKDAQVVETEVKGAGVKNIQIPGPKVIGTEVKEAGTKNHKDPGIAVSDQVQAISNSPELAMINSKFQQQPLNPGDPLIEKNIKVSSSSAISVEGNPKKTPGEMNTSQRDPLFDSKYPKRHLDSSSRGNNPSVKTNIQYDGNAEKLAVLSSNSKVSNSHAFEKSAGRPTADVPPRANNQNQVAANQPGNDLDPSENKHQSHKSSILSTLAKTIVASGIAENPKHLKEPLQNPKNLDISDPAKPSIAQMNKSGESPTVPQGKVADQIHHPANSVNAPGKDNESLAARPKNVVAYPILQKASSAQTNSVPMRQFPYASVTQKETRPLEPVPGPVQRMAKQIPGADQIRQQQATGYDSEVKKSPPPESLSKAEQQSDLKLMQDSTKKLDNDSSASRIKQTGQKSLDRNPVSMERKNDSTPLINSSRIEAQKSPMPAVSSGQQNQKVQGQGDNITSTQGDSVNPESSEKLIPNAVITTSISSMTPDKPKIKLNVKSTEARRSNHVSPTQYLRAIRSEQMQQSYGVDASQQRLAKDIEENPADILKEQLRDRIEFLKKTQSSIHLNQDLNPTLHRNLSVKGMPESGMAQNQGSVLPHPRVNAPLFARSFAGEMVEKFRELSEKMGSISNNQKPTFTVNGGSFGELDIEFDLEKSSEQVTIYVDDELSKTELQRVLPSIEDNLLQRGYNFTGLEVEVRNQHKDSEAMAQGKQKHSPKGEDETAPLREGESDDNKTNTNRNYGYNTMEVLA